MAGHRTLVLSDAKFAKGLDDYTRYGYNEFCELSNQADNTSRQIIFSTGTLRQATFTTGGKYVNVPNGAILLHLGKINAAGTNTAFIAVRYITSETSVITDWKLADGGALSSLITD